MKLTLFVHDLHPQIGHSRALIELLNGLSPEQKSQISSIEAVTYTTTDLNILFPEFKCTKKTITVPFKNIKPFILKMFFYHLFTYFYCLFFGKKSIKIGIGIACLNVDIANIQFVHEQWKPLFFSQRKLNLITLIYKKILFGYFTICENIFFANKKRSFIVIANFIQQYLTTTYQIKNENIFLIPSAVNPQDFSLSDQNTIEVWKMLTLEYPQLNKLDPSKHISLFVGAFERKGLDLVLNYLKNEPNNQLIIIGKPESLNNWSIPESINYAHIEFTKKVKSFYEVSDLFIFPTYYEPFGLVIIEAFSMGLNIIVPRDNVGASEILPEGNGLHFFNQGSELPKVSFEKLTKDDKIKTRTARLQKIKSTSWEEGAKTFQSILFKY